MINIIRGEIYRILHKKSLYTYFGSLAAAYFALAFMRSGGFNFNSILNDATNFFSFLPALAGAFLFSAIYTDDLNSKNLITLVGFGINKTIIVIAKLVLMILFSAVIFGLMPLFHCAVYAILGQTATPNILAMLYAVSLKFFLMTIVFSALSGIVVYGLQRTTFAIVLYILFAFNIIGGLFTMALNSFAPGLKEHLASGITDRILTGLISGSSIVGPTIEFIIFTAIAAALSVIAFHKKEMEF